MDVHQAATDKQAAKPEAPKKPDFWSEIGAALTSKDPLHEIASAISTADIHRPSLSMFSSNDTTPPSAATVKAEQLNPSKIPAVTDPREAIVPGETTHLQMTVDGKTRDVYVHAPADYDPSKPMPMMVVFNGLGYGYNGMPGGAPGMEQFTQLGATASKDGYLVVYPQGDGIAHGFNNQQLPLDNDNDIKFTQQLVNTFSNDLNVDKSKISFVGFSEGASFAHMAAAQMAGKVQAVVDVAGYRGNDAGSPTSPLSELSIHSAQDQTIPIQGNASDNSFVGTVEKWLGFQENSQDATTNFYRHLDGTAAQPTNVTNIQSRGGARSTETTYSNSTNNTKVTEVKVPNLQHGWPGSSDSPNSFNASALITDWLDKLK